MTYYNPDLKKITYPQLIMEQIKRIQEITAKELRNSSKVLKNAIGEQEFEEEDTRYSFLQAVETLGAMLYPYLTKDEKQFFDSFSTLCETELITALDHQEYLQEISLIVLGGNSEGDDESYKKRILGDERQRGEANVQFLKIKIRIGRQAFRILLQAFKNKNFLESEAFTEGRSGNDEGMEAVLEGEEAEVDFK